jgi:uncharacterized ferritin-like protein (DUF455 family)
MFVHEYAELVLLGPTLDDKLRPPARDLVDRPCPGQPVPSAPSRDASIAIATDRRAKRKVPSAIGFRDKAQAARILHGLANHELQAVELFAWALLRYPDAPPSFRRGLLRILGEEQIHLRLYLGRLEAYGVEFGSEPLSGYFWSKVHELTTPARFVAAMCLTFESANLDHALFLREQALAARDAATAAVLQRVHDDEIGHVRFGAIWLRRLAGRERPFVDVWLEHLTHPLRPALARGDVFVEESRVKAGLDPNYIDALRRAERPTALYRFARSTNERGPA